MTLPNVTKDKIWFILNSTFCFVSAFILVKGVIALSRYVVMKHFSAWVQFDNFELVCLNGSSDNIWTHLSVISIYGIGFIVAIVGVFITNILYRQFKSTIGLLKLFFIWSYLISLNQSLGVIIRDIPLKRDLYHAFNWMYFPFAVMIIITILATVILFILNSYNSNKFLRLANSTNEIKDNKSRRITYTRIALIPSIIGSVVILILHINHIEYYEIVELLLIILFMCAPYILLSKSEIPNKIKVYKEENSKKSNIMLIMFTIIVVIIFYIVKKFTI